MTSLNFTRPSWPLALLLVALSTIFLFSHERGLFYRADHHNHVSSEHLAVAVNLSPAHDFLQFRWRAPIAEGEVRYSPYNSFPMGGYILVKLVTLPFDGLSSQIYAAQMLMLLFSAAAALLAFDAVRRLTANPWIALAATLFAFASPYFLYYNDMICPETLGLFGMALVFHGMTIFVLEGRFRQLVAKTCVALLLDWHLFALLLPFTALGTLREALDAHGGWRDRWQRLALSRHLRLGAIAALFGLGLIALNLANDQRAYGNNRPLSNLPMVHSMLERFGLSEDFNAEYAEYVGLPETLGRALHRIGRMVPYALPGYTQNLGDFPTIGDAPDDSAAARVAGFVVIAGALVGLLFVRHQALLAAAALCGLTWELLMRHSAAFHDFVAQLHLGLCTLFFALALCWVRRVGGDRVLPAVALFAVACFVQSSWSMSKVGADEEASKRQWRMQADFEVIRKVVRGATVSVDRGLAPRSLTLEYYLHGSQVMRWPGERHDLADFTVMGHRMDIPGALTPGNTVAFLYDTEQLTAFVQGIIDGGRRVLEHADFDVYFQEGERVLIYVADATLSEEMRVLLHISAAKTEQLPAERRGAGFDYLNFTFRGFIHLDDGRPAHVFLLPDYPIRWITTGRMEFGDKVERWRRGFRV